MTYNIDRLKADLERAGVNLTVRSLNYFKNFSDSGCEYAIEWLLEYAPWTSRDTDLLTHKAKYVNLILESPDSPTVQWIIDNTYPCGEKVANVKVLTDMVFGWDGWQHRHTYGHGKKERMCVRLAERAEELRTLSYQQ